MRADWAPQTNRLAIQPHLPDLKWKSFTQFCAVEWLQVQLLAAAGRGWSHQLRAVNASLLIRQAHNFIVTRETITYSSDETHPSWRRVHGQAKSPTPTKN